MLIFLNLECNKLDILNYKKTHPTWKPQTCHLDVKLKKLLKYVYILKPLGMY